MTVRVINMYCTVWYLYYFYHHHHHHYHHRLNILLWIILTVWKCQWMVCQMLNLRWGKLRALAWTRLLLLTPRWKQWAPPQCGYLTTKLQGISSQKIIMLIFCGMKFLDYVFCDSGNGSYALRDEIAWIPRCSLQSEFSMIWFVGTPSTCLRCCLENTVTI